MSPNRGYYEDKCRPFLPENRDAPILDLGCGQGDFVRYLSGLGYRRITAVDRDSTAIAALENTPGVTAVEGDAASLDQIPGGYALIVAKQMIYYVDRREATSFVSALSHALAPNGRLVVEIFNGALLSSRFTELKDPAILTAYTENGLQRLLEQNGFVVEHLSGVKLRRRGFRGAIYSVAQAAWFSLYRALLIIERGRDDELPRLSSKSIIAVARRRPE